MPFVNLGFETAASAALPGTPNGWTETKGATGMEGASFLANDPNLTDNRPFPYEAFENDWSDNAGYTFAYNEPVSLAELDPMLFDGGLVNYEDMESGWSSNESYLFVMGSVDPMLFGGVDSYDGMETWVASYAVDWGSVSASAASFDVTVPEAVEDYEEEWSFNESYDFALGSVESRVFDNGVAGASNAYEDYEETKAPFSFLVDTVADTVIAASHALTVGQRVSFVVDGAGVLPGGLSPNYSYWIVAVTTDTFQVSGTLGGAAINITDNGIGAFIATADLNTFWTSFVTIPGIVPSFTPADIPGLFSDYNPINAVVSGGLVTSWPDSASGFGTLTPTTANPAYTAIDAIFNNKPSVNWSAVAGAYLDSVATGIFSQPSTWFIVAGRNGAALNGTITDSVTGGRNIIRGQSTTGWEIWSGAWLTDGVVTSGPHKLAAIFNSTSSVIYKDDFTTPAISGNAGLSVAGSLRLGADFSDSSGSRLNGSVARVLIYNRLLTTTEIRTIGNYLASEYGTPG